MINSLGMEHASSGQNQRLAFGARHIFALREYWSWCCAVCETASYPIQCTPWRNASGLNSPNLAQTNMLPLCSVCIGQKGNADPHTWLGSVDI